MLVWYGFMIKNYDFDRVMLSVNWVLLESIDFTCVLNDFWFANKLVLMCCFFIIYGIFDWVRLKPYFIRAERCFEYNFGDF